MYGFLKIDHKERQLVMSREFAKYANNTMSEEYAHLQAVRKDYPLYKVVLRTIRRNENKECYKGLTYEYMESYILTHGTHEERNHEGVAARAMEKKGIISDRCELNRQIKADNVLLRELKDLVAMLTEFVADAADSVADQLTKLREKLIVICYQIKVIIRGMDKRTATIQATQPKLKRYNEITQQIRQKTKARKALVAEQKNTSKLNLIKQHDLSRQITTLTEETEELRSEKEKLLLDLGCADDAGVKAVQSEVTAMEASLHKLDEQKERYSVELDETLQQYKQLQSQAEAEDQQKIRTDAAAAAAARLQQAYGKHYNAQLARESQQDVAAWLGESTQPTSIREFLHRAEKKTHSTPNHHKDTPER